MTGAYSSGLLEGSRDPREVPVNPVTESAAARFRKPRREDRSTLSSSRLESELFISPPLRSSLKPKVNPDV